MEPVEVVDVKTKIIACDGNGTKIGHPRVFLNMGEKSYIDCPYCGRRFRIQEQNIEKIVK